MRFPFLVVCAATGVLLQGCAGQDFSRNLYEGIRLNNASQQGTPRETPPMPTYDQYRRERSASANRQAQ